jgi:hypothetical protein
MSKFSFEIEALRDAITEYVSKEPRVLDSARSQFALALEGDEGIVEADLLEWLIWDFNFEGKSLIDRYRSELSPLFDTAILDSARKSKLAFVKWNQSAKGGFFKDILTNRDFRLMDTPEGVNEPHIALMRFFHYEGYDLPVGEIKYYDLELKESIRRGMLEKYNEVYTAKPQTIEEFVYLNPLALYAYAQIIDMVSEQEEDESYTVYQATYKIMDLDKLQEGLAHLPCFDPTEDSDVFVLELPEAIIGEVVITDWRFDVEATDQEKLRALKVYVERHLDHCLQHVKDEVLSLEDVI